jgi:hypothetical protein
VLTPVTQATAFTPHRTTFAVPITLSLFYEAPRGVALTVLRLDDENDTTWEFVPAEFKDGVAFFQTTHFSIYSVTACDPADDPAGLCSDLTSGAKPLDELTPDELKPFEPPSDAGTDEPPATEPDAGKGEEPDAGKSDEQPDAGVDEPKPEDAGAEPSKDLDAAAPDAGPVSDRDAGDAPDAGPLPGEVGCDWVERCRESVGCAGPDGVLSPVGADGQCPEGSKLFSDKVCRIVQVCTAAYCELHPDVCSGAGGDASVPPTFDGGLPPDADGGAAEPGCGFQKKCDVRRVCPADLPDASPAADAGFCYVTERCDVPRCDLPSTCEDKCTTVERCDATGTACKTEQVCEQLCLPNPECPKAVCTPYEVCEPIFGCPAADMVSVEICEDVYVCGGSAEDAGAELDASADATVFDPCSRLAECLAMQDKCSATLETAVCIDCQSIVQRCAK